MHRGESTLLVALAELQLANEEQLSAAAAQSRVETRSIDYVPSAERSGRLGDQATIWFAGSAQLLSLATGAIGIGLGLNLG